MNCVGNLCRLACTINYDRNRPAGKLIILLPFCNQNLRNKVVSSWKSTKNKSLTSNSRFVFLVGAMARPILRKVGMPER
jgi:hypothetical protein